MKENKLKTIISNVKEINKKYPKVKYICIVISSVIILVLISALIFNYFTNNKKTTQLAKDFPTTYTEGSDTGLSTNINSKKTSDISSPIITNDDISVSEESYVHDILPYYPSGSKTDFIENDFISTEENPISTFSSDVDTASYVTFRQLVNSQYDLLNSNSTKFRTEEFLNYFSYNYNSPEANKMFGVTTEVGICPWNNKNSLVRIGIKATELTKQTNKPLNLVFLIDTSGSMSSEEKLPLLIESLSSLLKKLDKDDTISIVTYSGSSSVVLSGANGTEKLTIKNALTSLNASGGTNGGAGLKMAYAEAKKYFSENKNNRIMLCTDGDLNVGMTSTDEIKEYISKQRKSGIYMSVLGFGNSNYNDEILETIADNGNGNYSIIDNAKEAKKVLLDEFNGTINTVATDVKFQVKFDPNKINSYRLIGYENRVMSNEDFDDDTKDAGDVGYGETITVVYEINSNELLTKDAMALNIRYKNNYTSKSTKESYMIDCTPSKTPSNDFILVSALSELVMVLNDSKYATNSSIDTVLKQLKPISSDNEERQELYTLVLKVKQNCK